MKKIDIHCHILPGLDDGAESVKRSLSMIRMASGQGISAVIATPHHSNMYGAATPIQIRQQCRTLEMRAQQSLNIEFHIYPGQEILYSDNVIERLNRGELLTLADSRYVLIEFLPNIPYSILYRSIREMVAARYRPVLAHVERYGALRVDGRIEELYDAGAYMQMNYRPVGGRWFDETTRWCRRMLKAGNIHFLGTDMHNTDGRRPQTREAMLWMAKHIEREDVAGMCYKNAQAVLTDRLLPS